MERFIDPCCDKCTHSKETPCEQFIDCCLNGPLCHEDSICAEKRKAIIRKAARSPDFVVF
ncbi:MAG: CCxxC motif-containing NuoF prefix domain-containing protein [Dethiobacteria bacterium]|jgi:hypothetical protein